MPGRTSISGTPPLSPVRKTSDQQHKLLREEHIIEHFPELSAANVNRQEETDFESKHEEMLFKELQKEFDLININNPIVSFEEVCNHCNLFDFSYKMDSTCEGWKFESCFWLPLVCGVDVALR